MADFAAWAELRETSRKFLTPWEPTWPADDLTRPAFRQRLRRYAEDMRTDQAYPFFLFRTEDNALIGGLALANIRRGVAQAGSLGYWIGAPHIRRGYMTAAVRALVPAAFDVLRLHRVEAACIPTNLASVRLLEKTGFRREGYARSYLCINGIVAGPPAVRAASEPIRAIKASRIAADAAGRPWGRHVPSAIKASAFTWI